MQVLDFEWMRFCLYLLVSILSSLYPLLLKTTILFWPSLERETREVGWRKRGGVKTKN